MNRIDSIDVGNKTVLLRTSLNVPLSDKGEILDDFRLQSAIPTIRFLIGKGAKVVLIGHLGRPDGVNESLSLSVVKDRLKELLNKDILFIKDSAKEQIQGMDFGGIALLENLRFDKREIENDEGFAKELANLGDIYVNDSFDVSHREHASVVLLPKLLPSAIGLSFEREIDSLKNIIESPKEPFVVIIGGNKVKTKTKFLKDISKKATIVLLGNVVSNEVKENIDNVLKSIDEVSEIEIDFDLGPKTIALFEKEIKKAKTIFWTGPLGKVEDERYQKGSLAIADSVINSKSFSVIGGGHLAAFLGFKGLKDEFSHVSIGGGSLLAFLSKGTLPGIEVLK